MKPVQQTIMRGDSSGRPGNCMQAAVASLAGVPLDKVPHFAEEPERRWWRTFVEWAEARGLAVVRVWLQRTKGDDGYMHMVPGPFGLGVVQMVAERSVLVLAVGKSPRGEENHVVLAQVVDGNDLRPFHDPHPDATFLRGPAMEVWMLVPFGQGSEATPEGGTG